MRESFFALLRGGLGFDSLIYPKTYKNALEANFEAYRELILSYIEGFLAFA